VLGQLVRTGQVRVDIGDPASIDRMLKAVGTVGAVVCAAAHASITPLGELGGGRLAAALRHKLLGQASLLVQSLPYLSDGGSITLTAGNFVQPPPGSAIGVLANEGLRGFVWAAVPDLPRGIRANVVSPGWVSETLTVTGVDGGTPAEKVAGVPGIDPRRRYGLEFQTLTSESGLPRVREARSAGGAARAWHRSGASAAAVRRAGTGRPAGPAPRLRTSPVRR